MLRAASSMQVAYSPSTLSNHNSQGVMDGVTNFGVTTQPYASLRRNTPMSHGVVCEGGVDMVCSQCCMMWDNYSGASIAKRGS